MWRRLSYAVAYRTRRTPWDTGVTPPELVDLIEGPDALPAGRALDLGCGTGTNVAYLAEHGWDATGVEADRRAFEGAEHRLVTVSDARVFRGDVTRLDTLPVDGPFILSSTSAASIRSHRDGVTRTRTASPPERRRIHALRLRVRVAAGPGSGRRHDTRDARPLRAVVRAGWEDRGHPTTGRRVVPLAPGSDDRFRPRE